MSIGALDAATAYGRVSDLKDLRPTTIGSTGLTPASTGDFGAAVESMIAGTSTSMQAAETASARQVAGKGDLVDVATAIGAAETALDTMVAVRDRVVGAYTEIMRMQI